MAIFMNPLRQMKDEFIISLNRTMKLFLGWTNRILMKKFIWRMSNQFIWFIAKTSFHLRAHVYKM